MTSQGLNFINFESFALKIFFGLLKYLTVKIQISRRSSENAQRQTGKEKNREKLFLNFRE